MPFNLVTKRESWKLTWYGRLLLALLFLAISWFTAVGIYPFLAITQKVPANVLVIDGWMQANNLKRALAEFRSGEYERLLFIQPVLDGEDQNEPGRYCRRWVLTWLLQQGVTNSQLATLHPQIAMKDRTYHSALAVKAWLKEQGLTGQPINVITQGLHARRSRLLYEKVFGDSYKLGIIGLTNQDYDPAHWWRTSAGVREVVGESIAYLYVRFLFSPTMP